MMILKLLRQAREDSRESIAARDYLRALGYSEARIDRACRRYTPPVSILSVDAWRDGDSWIWNAWYPLGKCDVSICELDTRKLLAWLRREGYLSEHSAGRVTIEDDQYNVVVIDRRTCEPILAIAYGEAYR